MINKKIKKNKLKLEESSGSEISIKNIKNPSFNSEKSENKNGAITNSKNIKFKFKYWDGFNIYKNIIISSDILIAELLELCKLNLLSEYPFLKTLKADTDLLLVMNYKIIPIELKLNRILSILELNWITLIYLRNV